MVAVLKGLGGLPRDTQKTVLNDAMPDPWMQHC